jgi:glucose-6-phosphate isomerase
MIQLDIKNALAKTITPSYGIRDQELSAQKGSIKSMVEKWIAQREGGEHNWASSPYDRTIKSQTIDCAERAHDRGIDTVVWIGMGGSALCPRVIQDIFETPDTIEFIVLDTIDPAVLSAEIPLLNWKRTLVVIASKSGNTLESMSVFFLLWERLREVHKEKANEYVIAVTDPDSGPLHDLALEHNFALLPIQKTIGGRFCVFSPVGLLPLALLKRDINRFVSGAKHMDTLCQIPTLDENPAASLAVVQYLLDTQKGLPMRVIMPYVQRLQNLARWNQQLIAESLGKTETNNPVPLASIGTADQHSLLQQWMDGVRLCWHIFIKEEEYQDMIVPDHLPDEFRHISGKQFGTLFSACHDGTAQALANAKRPNVTLTLRALNEESLGALFFMLMAEVVFLGNLYRIDPYGQPGVELGKKITRKILEQR